MNNARNDGKTKKKMDDKQLSAVAISVTVVVFFVIYWAAQIQTTYALLSSAYGW
ncbi:MAG: hypothetical protein WD772_04555 [Pseudohongiellaceae bacterium]